MVSKFSKCLDPPSIFCAVLCTLFFFLASSWSLTVEKDGGLESFRMPPQKNLPPEWYTCGALAINETDDFVPEDHIRFYLFTKQNFEDGDLLEIKVDGPISEIFDPSAPVKFILHGFLGNIEVGAAPILVNAYLSPRQNSYNVILADWGGLAGNESNWQQYCRAVHYTRLVAEKSAQLLDHLIQNGHTTADQVHIIGHGVGAHVAGLSGRSLNSGLVARMTGLDPSYPSFQDPSASNRISENDANFVDIIHTSAPTSDETLTQKQERSLDLGFTEPLGHIDFYPGGGKNQPGCQSVDDESDPLCGSAKAYLYFAESIKRPLAFPAQKCSNWDDFGLSNCEPETANMGEWISSAARGKFYLWTHNTEPYGLGCDDDSCFSNSELSCASAQGDLGTARIIKCPLSWEPFISSSTLPPKAVPVSEGNSEFFIGRAHLENGWMVMGRLAKNEDTTASAHWKLISAHEGGQLENSTFEVLVNPLDCEIWWTSVLNKTLSQGTDVHGFAYVGRVEFEKKTFPGQIFSSSIHFSVDEREIVDDKNFQILLSIQRGLQVKVEDFTFDTDESGFQTDFLGMDEIRNAGPVTIRHRVSHSKTVFEKYQIQTNLKTKFATKVCIKAELSLTVGKLESSGLGVELCQELELGYETSSTFGQETSREITISREVAIPPYTNVQICSTVANKDAFSLPYSAVAKYTAPGMSALDVLAVLLEDDVQDYTLDPLNGAVLVNIQGVFVGSVATAPKFVIADMTEGSNDACAQIVKRKMGQ